MASVNDMNGVDELRANFKKVKGFNCQLSYLIDELDKRNSRDLMEPIRKMMNCSFEFSQKIIYELKSSVEYFRQQSEDIQSALIAEKAKNKKLKNSICVQCRMKLGE